jgi:hypothetical protein
MRSEIVAAILALHHVILALHHKADALPAAATILRMFDVRRGHHG